MTVNRSKTLGRKVEQLRTGRGWSQEELAKKVGTTQQSIHALESGLVEHPRYLSKLVSILGVSHDELLGQPSENVKKLDTLKRVPILTRRMVVERARTGAVEVDGGSQTTAYIAGSDDTVVTEVLDESMIGDRYAFFPGELIHVDLRATNPAPGAYVLAHLPDSGKTLFRQLKQDETGDRYLAPLSRHFPPTFADFEILGRVVARTSTL